LSKSNTRAAAAATAGKEAENTRKYVEITTGIINCCFKYKNGCFGFLCNSFSFSYCLFRGVVKKRNHFKL